MRSFNSFFISTASCVAKTLARPRRRRKPPPQRRGGLMTSTNHPQEKRDMHTTNGLVGGGSGGSGFADARQVSPVLSRVNAIKHELEGVIQNLAAFEANLDGRGDM